MLKNGLRANNTTWKLVLFYSTPKTKRVCKDSLFRIRYSIFPACRQAGLFNIYSPPPLSISNTKENLSVLDNGF
jgi:hypothetical protein